MASDHGREASGRRGRGRSDKVDPTPYVVLALIFIIGPLGGYFYIHWSALERAKTAGETNSTVVRWGPVVNGLVMHLAATGPQDWFDLHVRLKNVSPRPVSFNTSMHGLGACGTLELDGEHHVWRRPVGGNMTRTVTLAPGQEYAPPAHAFVLDSVFVKTDGEGPAASAEDFLQMNRPETGVYLQPWMEFGIRRLPRGEHRLRFHLRLPGGRTLVSNEVVLAIRSDGER